MKQAVVISVLVVSLVSLALAQGESETQLKESERSYGLTDTGKSVVIAILIGVSALALGPALLEGRGVNRRKHSPLHHSNYQKDVLNFPDNKQLINGISNNYPQVASSPITTPGKLRQKRTTTPLRYNRDGTISIQCRFNPESCRNRRQRRDGKKLLSLYLKPPAAEGSAIDNLRQAWGIKPKNRARPGSKGKRLISLQWRKSPKPQKKVPRKPQGLYARAFQRFTDDISGRTRKRKIVNRRIARPRPRARRLRPRFRGRRAPPRHLPQKRVDPKGKEVFSLFLKPPAARPKFVRAGRYGAAKVDVPLICRFQPQLCGRKGLKLFSLHYKGFRKLFPYAL